MPEAVAGHLVSRPPRANMSLALLLLLSLTTPPPARPMGVPETFTPTPVPPRTSSRVEETPYVVYLTVDAINCTGALLGTGWTLTSAFCFSESWRGRSWAMAGAPRFVEPGDLWRASAQFDPLVELLPHPQYRRGAFEHNVMLARAATKFGVSAWVRPLEVTPLTRWPRGWRAACTVSGMGQTRPEEPTGRLTTTAGVDVRGVEHCEPWADDAVRQYTLCTREAASVFCYGDQGGPVVHKGYLLAIQTSAAFRRPSRTDCGDRVLYQIYTFVGYYRPWIYSVVPHQTWNQALRAASLSPPPPAPAPLCALLLASAASVVLVAAAGN